MHGAARRIMRESAPVNGHAAFDEQTGYKLVFEATQTQPDYAKLFLSAGGAINTAAGASDTDFSVTDSTASVKTLLGPNHEKTITIDLPAGLLLDVGVDVAANETGKRENGCKTVAIDASAKLNYSSQRIGAAINGSIGPTNAGQGSVYLANFLRKRGTHMQCPVVYGTLASHSSTIGASNMRILTKDGHEVDVVFIEEPEKLAQLAKAEALVDAWAHSSWAMREKLVYKLSPTLTKSVAKVPVGVNDKGYELVHNVIDQESPYSLKALNSMFEHAVGIELGYDPDDTQQMMDATARPGLRAAVWAQTVACACSTIANYLMPYRADGVSVMQAAGSAFEGTESWIRGMRPFSANDCDGSALTATTMLQSAIDLTDEELEPYPYLRAVKHAVYPYYTFGVAVVGATAAEASAGGGDADTVAGHAVALMVPTLAFLAGLDRGAADGKTLGGDPVSTDAAALRKARFDAVFNQDVLRALPEHEQERLIDASAGDVSAWKQASVLKPFAVEGTTPASPVLYMSTGEGRETAERDAALDAKVFGVAAPNIGRGLKIMHVGGSHTDDPHRFYHDFVELSIHPRHPLYAHPGVRELGEGASQFVFGKTPTGKALTDAGASPRQLSMGDFVVLPLHRIDASSGKILDFAAAASKRDVVPPRAGPTVLSASQTANAKRSLAAFTALSAGLSDDDKTPGHSVGYIFSYSTLIENPLAVEHFCSRVADVANAGMVDIATVSNLALDAEGGEAGHFVVVNARVNV